MKRKYLDFIPPPEVFSYENNNKKNYLIICHSLDTIFCIRAFATWETAAYVSLEHLR